MFVCCVKVSSDLVIRLSALEVYKRTSVYLKRRLRTVVTSFISLSPTSARGQNSVVAPNWAATSLIGGGEGPVH